jgi:hypothetical protein
MLANIKISWGSKPAFADIDADNDFDLLVGSDDPDSSKFYLNDGNNVYTQNISFFSNVDFPRSCAPAFTDVDNDGDVDLFLGSLWGEIDYYENTGDSANPVWQINNNLLQGLEFETSVTPGFADLDDDGRLDLIVGQQDGNFTFYRNLFALVSVDDQIVNIPETINLKQNYPNPFNPITHIEYSITGQSFVQLKIYDLLGKEIKTLVNEIKPAGFYRTEFNGANYSSGVYFYKLNVNGKVLTKKMILQK